MVFTDSVIEYTFEFVDTYVPKWFAKGTAEPLFIYVSGPQGSGKSYTSSRLYEHLVEQYGQEKSIAYMSVDDFYLTHEDQLKVNEQYKDNKLLQGRGLPGTHDMSLLNTVLQSILQRRGDDDETDKGYIHIPRYDKSKFNGEGDRSESVMKCKAPVDICIFEGWFLGYEPVFDNNEEEQPLLEGDMIDVNAKLFMYSDLMWNNPEICSLAIVFSTDDIDNVYSWRIQQEHESIEVNGSGMTDEEVGKFVDRYMPCYKLYFESFVHSEKLGSVATLTLGIDKNRTIFSTKTRCIE